MKFTYTGLSEQEVRDSRNQHGSNAVTTQDVETFWDKLIANLKDPIIMILIVALLVTLALAALGFAPWYEGLGIAIAVVLATLVATFSEYSNESEFQSLLEEASKIRVKVFRAGTLQEILIDELVVNDLILLQPGDTIPADGYLLEGELDVNESALTGESEPVEKTGSGDESQINEEQNGLSRAGLVEDGEGVMKVQAVGDKTKYGATMKELISAEDRLSPLQQKLAKLGKQITNFGYIGATFIALAYMSNHVFFDPMVGYAAHGSFTTYLAQPPGAIIYHLVTAIILAIIIIVVAVPEGLPMMIAVVLSLNMRKLLRANVLVRKLLGIETSGSLNILFSDKTGTLTEGRLQVAAVLTGDSKNYNDLTEVPEPVMNEIGFGLRNNTSASIDLTDPEIKDYGVRKMNITKRVYISSEDLNFKEGDIIRLKDFCNIKIIKIGEKIHADFVSKEVIKGVAKIQWVNDDFKEIKLLDPKLLYPVKNEIDKNSMKSTFGYVENNILNLELDTIVQFEIGFAKLQNIDNEITGHFIHRF